MKVWLKGGFVGLLIGIIVLITFFLINPAFKINETYSSLQGSTILFLYIPFLAIFFLISFLFCMGNRYCSNGNGSWIINLLSYTISIIIFLILIFLIGSLIGWTIEKIRSKKNR